jgi:hypothetical protein
MKLHAEERGLGGAAYDGSLSQPKAWSGQAALPSQTETPQSAIVKWQVFCVLKRPTAPSSGAFLKTPSRVAAEGWVSCCAGH